MVAGTHQLTLRVRLTSFAFRGRLFFVLECNRTLSDDAKWRRIGLLMIALSRAGWRHGRGVGLSIRAQKGRSRRTFNGLPAASWDYKSITYVASNPRSSHRAHDLCRALAALRPLQLYAAKLGELQAPDRRGYAIKMRPERAIPNGCCATMPCLRESAARRLTINIISRWAGVEWWSRMTA